MEGRGGKGLKKTTGRGLGDGEVESELGVLRVLGDGGGGWCVCVCLVGVGGWGGGEGWGREDWRRTVEMEVRDGVKGIIIKSAHLPLRSITAPCSDVPGTPCAQMASTVC